MLRKRVRSKLRTPDINNKRCFDSLANVDSHHNYSFAFYRADLTVKEHSSPSYSVSGSRQQGSGHVRLGDAKSTGADLQNVSPHDSISRFGSVSDL
jgi:hypothetical protein